MAKKKNGHIQKSLILEKDEIEFEDVLEEVGPMGRFQFLVWFICGLAEMQTGSANLYFIFSNYNPVWNCTRYSGLDYGGESGCLSNSSECQEFDFDTGVFHSIISEWELVCGQSYIPNVLTSIQFAGLLVGGALFGQLGDLIGRKKTYLICVFGISISSVLTGVSPNWYAFAVFRFLCGAFVGGNFCNGWMYSSEFVGASHRPFVFLTGFYNIGSLWLNLFAFYFRRWDHLAYMIGGAGVILVPLAAWLVPESPRWLIQRRRFKDAERVIERMSIVNGNGELDHSIKESLPRILRNEEATREKAGRFTYLDLVKTKQLAMKTAAVCTIWFTLSYVFYLISVQLSTFPGNIYFKMLVQPLAISACLWISMPVVMRMSRKKVYIGLGCLASCLLILLVVLRTTGVMDGASTGFTVLAIGGQVIASTQWCSTGGTTVEIYPTLLRTMAFGAAGVAARVAGILAPQIDTLGSLSHWTLPYLIAICLMIASCVLLQVLLPETAGQPISENFKTKKPENDIPLEEASETLQV